MFAYNPQSQDRSGEILAAAQIQAQARRDAQQQQMWQGISNGISSAMDGISEGMSKAAENRIASDGANAKFDMLKDYKKTDGQPLFTQETIDKFDTMPLGKRQAYVQTAEAILDDDLKKWMYQTQYNAQNNRINAQALAQQPAANQVPMGGAAPPAAAVSPDTTQSPGIIAPGIKTRSYF